MIGSQLRLWNLNPKRARLNHDRVKIIRCFAVAAKLEVNLVARVRGRQDFGDKPIALGIKIVSGMPGSTATSGWKFRRPMFRIPIIEAGKQIETWAPNALLRRLQKL
jgi:hypothetical protein